MNRAFFQKVLHRLFTLFMSLSGALAFVFFIRAALPEGFVKPLGITVAFIAVLDALSMLVHDLFVSEKANGFTYLRYAVYLNIVLIIIIKFCKPVISTGLLWAGTNLAVVLTYLIKRMFDFYELFVEHTSGMDGKELSSDLVENNWYVSDYINCAKSLIFSLFIISLVLSACVLALHLLGRNISPALYASLICFIASFAGLIIIHTVNDHETSFAFLGHAAIFNFRKRIMIICVLLCLLSVAGGAILSSDTPVLKPSYFSWILKPFSFEEIPDEIPGYNSGPGVIDEEFDLEDVGNLREDSLLSKIMHEFFIIFEYVLIAAITGGIIVFLTAAFFGKKWKDFWKNKKLSAFLKNVWVRLKKLIYDLLHMEKKKKVAWNTAEAASFKDAMKSLLSGARKSREKRAELDALTRIFMQLVDYAASQGVSYKPHMAPLEFARILADALVADTGDSLSEAGSLTGADAAEKAPAASRAGAALAAGRLFEQALYAKELLTKEERAQFEESIAAACR